MSRDTGSGPRPSDTFRDDLRAKFTAEARSLYGERSRSGWRWAPFLAGAASTAAAVIIGLAIRNGLESRASISSPEDFTTIAGSSVNGEVSNTAFSSSRPVPLFRGTPEEKSADEREENIVGPASPAADPNEARAQLAPEREPVALASVQTRAGTRVIAERDARWEWTEDRKISIAAGRLYLDVEPAERPFEIVHPDGRVSVLGTRLLVDASEDSVRVGLGSGKAHLENDSGGIDLEPGEEGILTEKSEPEKHSARRFSHLVSFASEEFDEADSTARAVEAFSPGTAKSPRGGEEFELEVVRYHLDVHLEDGMARTTLDETFRNPSAQRVEGTFLFPLPPDASISRLAMYVDGKLMEGGMAERSRAVEVYEGIVKKMLDPAILEWIEGSTFRLRVFPIEPGAERRIILSFQAPLESLYETDRYRFPILYPKTPFGEFSARIFAKGAAGSEMRVRTPTYLFERSAETPNGVELVLEEKNARPAKDLIIEIEHLERPAVEYASFESGPDAATNDDEKSLCVTVRPEITDGDGDDDGGRDGGVYRGARRVLVLLDRSGKASSSERRAQSRLAKALVRALDRTDRIAVVAYDTEAKMLTEGFEKRTTQALDSLLELVDAEPFVGAGDLARALRKAKELFETPQAGDTIFYLGDGVDTLSGLGPERIAEILPREIPFIALPVNRSWDRRVLASIAKRSGGRVIPVSPDEKLSWRAFDVVSSLRSPVWAEVKFQLVDEAGDKSDGEFFADRTTVRDGEPLRLAGRIASSAGWPSALLLNGKKIELPKRRPGAGWVPRFVTKLEIDELETDSAEEHRDEIVRLGKKYYVMTPFTSLLVLENDAMYEQYNVDRGRTDHWARYEAPATWYGKATPPQPVFWRYRFGNNWRGRPWGIEAIDSKGPALVPPQSLYYYKLPGGETVRVAADTNWWARLNEQQLFGGNQSGPSQGDGSASGQVRGWNGRTYTFSDPAQGAIQFENGVRYNAWVFPGADGITVSLDDRVLVLGGDFDSYGGGGEPLTLTAEVFLPPSQNGQVFLPWTKENGSTDRFTNYWLDANGDGGGAPLAAGFSAGGGGPGSDLVSASASPLYRYFESSATRPEMRFASNTTSDASGAIRSHSVVNSESDSESESESDSDSEKPSPAPVTIARFGDHGRAGAVERLANIVVSKDSDVVAAAGDTRFLLLEGGARVLVGKGSATLYSRSGVACRDPFFETPLPVAAPMESYRASFPWFLVSAELLTAGADVDSRDEDGHTVLTVDAGGWTRVEILVDGVRPIEIRTVLDGGDVIGRVEYSSWETVNGRELPARARSYGPDGGITGEIEIVYAVPSDEDRALAERLEAAVTVAAKEGEREQEAARTEPAQEDAGGAGAPGDGSVTVASAGTGTGAGTAAAPASSAPDTPSAKFLHALSLYAAANRDDLETYLRDLGAKGELTMDLRKIAALASLRWETAPVVAIPAIDRKERQVERWLGAPRAEPSQEVAVDALRRAYDAADLSALAVIALSAKDSPAMILELDALRARSPRGLASLIDLYAGELAEKKDRKLRAYESFARAASWKPLAGSVALSDRLSELAVGLNDVERGLEYAERSLELITKRGAKPQAARFKSLAELATKRADLWKERGALILDQWADAYPNDAEPFRRLADFHKAAGEVARAIRYASQEVEIEPSEESYTRLAEVFEATGQSTRAEACRSLGAKLAKK